MFGKKKKRGGGPFSFRVSDVVDVPLRGILLRLRLVDGSPAVADLGVGSKLRLQPAGGAEREVQIKAHSVTAGRPTQERLDRTREFDVVIEDAGGEPIEIGWMATGPV